MLDLSKKLSQGLRHARVDFYELPDGSLRFSELTFCASSGLKSFVPEKHDEEFGRLILEPGPTA